MKSIIVSTKGYQCTVSREDMVLENNIKYSIILRNMQ